MEVIDIWPITMSHYISLLFSIYKPATVAAAVAAATDL